MWNPGDGSDAVEGQSGNDTLQFNGSNANENIDLSANGTRLRFFRDVGNVTMDVNGLERVNFAALGGADQVVVNDLTGTGVSQVNVNLAASLGSNAGDGLQDTVVVNGTNGADNIKVDHPAGMVRVSGLAALVNIINPEAVDRLNINSLGGNDRVDAAPSRGNHRAGAERRRRR